MADDWQRCLKSSDANPLFMSWPWLFSWWETWSQVWGLELLLLGVFDESGNLVGIGSFYYRDLITPVGIRVKRIHLLGNAWRIAPTVRTEYCSFILNKTCERAARQALLGYLSELEWDELILCDITEEKLNRFRGCAQNSLGNLVEVPRLLENGIFIDTSDSFSAWLDGLGRNTRLKIYNRRRYLAKLGEQGLSKVEGAAAFHNTLEKLNSFHRTRWGKPAFDPDAMAFHDRLFGRLTDHGMTVGLSELTWDGKTVSVLYDIIVGGWRFNLQAGYQEEFDPKVSLGSLHLGYAIEEAFKADGVHTYDMLAGSGKKSFYKARFNGTQVQFHTLQMVRREWLKRAYQRQEQLPHRWRRLINRAFRL